MTHQDILTIGMDTEAQIDSPATIPTSAVASSGDILPRATEETQESFATMLTTPSELRPCNTFSQFSQASAASRCRRRPDVLRRGPLPIEKRMRVVGKHAIRTEKDGSWHQQENKDLAPRAAKALSRKTTSNLYHEAINDHRVRRTANSVFGLVIVFVPTVVEEITPEWTLAEWIKLPQNCAHYETLGTASYIGEGLLLTNAHLFEWPADAKDTDKMVYEPRIYACNGTGVLTAMLNNRSRAEVVRYSPFLDRHRQISRSGNLLRSGAMNMPGAEGSDWAILKILDKARWPKAKYAMRPGHIRGTSSCIFNGANQADDGRETMKSIKDPDTLHRYKKCVRDLLPGQISTCRGMITTTQDETEHWHDISTLPGSSGSPLLIQVRGRRIMVGIHSAAMESEVKGAPNTALSLQADQLCTIVWATLQTAGADKSILRRWTNVQYY